jgi:flavin reductase (DIM6/NTAB) family NADH-FMN oxidoreductase RutF
VSIMSEWFVEAANHCCGDFPPDVDELALSGLTAVPAVHCKAPLIGESGVNMECKVSSLTCSYCILVYIIYIYIYIVPKLSVFSYVCELARTQYSNGFV